MLKIAVCQNCKRSFWSKTKKMYVLWTTDLEGNKLTTHGGYYSFPEAEAVPLELKPTEKRISEKVYLCTEKYCRECQNLVKNINKRAMIEQKKRRKEQGIKGNKAIPIADEDAKRFMKFLVDKKVEEQQRQKEQEIAQIGKEKLRLGTKAIESKA